MAEKVTKNLSPKQLKTIETLLTNGSVDSAATAAGVSRNSIYKWFKDETFVSELRKAEAEALTSLSRSLVGLGDKATEALRAALDDIKPSVRLRAAEIVLGNLLRLRELVDIESRLTALEKNYENSNEGGTA